MPCWKKKSLSAALRERKGARLTTVVFRGYVRASMAPHSRTSLERSQVSKSGTSRKKGTKDSSSSDSCCSCSTRW